MSRIPRRKLPTNPNQTQRKLVRREPTKTQEDRAGGVMRTLYPASPRADMARRKKLEAGGEHALVDLRCALCVVGEALLGARSVRSRHILPRAWRQLRVDCEHWILDGRGSHEGPYRQRLEALV